MEKLGMIQENTPCPPQPVSQLKERLRFIDENAYNLQDITRGLEECLERLTGPEPKEGNAGVPDRKPEGLFEELDLARENYSKLVGRLGAVTERLQQAI
jgi:hypothetical protein